MATKANSKKPTKATKSAAKAKTSTKSNGLKWGALITTSLAMFIIVINTTVLNASLGNVVESVDTNVAGVQGAIAMYALITAAFVLPASRLGERFGRKSTFIAGIVLFTIGALVASYATNLMMLVLGWSVIQGLGSALMLSQIQNTLGTSVRNKDRTMAFGAVGAVVASAAAFGPVIGGLVTDSFGWEWVFRGEAIIAALVLILSYTLNNETIKQKIKLDMKAVWLNAVGMALIVLGVLLSTKYGFIQPRQPLVLGDGVSIAPFGLSIVIFMIGFGLVFLYQSLRRSKAKEAAKEQPLFKPSLFKNKQLTTGLVVLMIQSVLQMGVLFGVAVFLQVSLDLNAVDTGLALLPMSVSILIVSFLSPGLGRKFLPKSIIGVGFLLMALGLLLLDTVIQVGMTTTDMIPGFVIFGIGVGLLVSQIQNLVLSAVDTKDSSEATALNGSAQQFGNAIGTAVFGTFIIIGLTFGLGNALEDQGIYDTQSRDLLSSTIKQDINNLNDDELDALLSSVPEEVIEQITTIKTQAEFDAMKTAMGLLAAVAVIGFLVSTRIPAKKLV